MSSIPSPNRDDSMLGDGWTWSVTTQWKCANDVYKLAVHRGKIMLSLRQGRPDGEIVISGGETPCPIMKMLLLTHVDWALGSYAERLKSL